MKKKITIPILILLILIPILAIKLGEKKEEKKLKQVAVTYKNAIKDYNKKQHIEDGNYVVDSNGMHNEKYNYKFDGIKPENGSITIYNNSIEHACLTINNKKIIIENDEIISQEEGICEYEIIPTKEEYAKESIRNYVDQIPSINIAETRIYDVSTINEQINLMEYPTEGWVSISTYEERIDVSSYSIKFNDIIVTNTDGTQKITQELEPRP